MKHQSNLTPDNDEENDVIALTKHEFQAERGLKEYLTYFLFSTRFFISPPPPSKCLACAVHTLFKPRICREDCAYICHRCTNKLMCSENRGDSIYHTTSPPSYPSGVQTGQTRGAISGAPVFRGQLGSRFGNPRFSGALFGSFMYIFIREPSKRLSYVRVDDSHVVYTVYNIVV